MDSLGRDPSALMHSTRVMQLLENVPLVQLGDRERAFVEASLRAGP